MADKVKLTIRAQSYLRCIDDWKAPFEVAALLGDSPAPSIEIVTRTLRGLVGRGLAAYHPGNNTFAITQTGRAHLASSGKGN